jgi:hypothetical protein
MTVEAVLARLKGVKRSRSGWIARCPAHPDRNPSLSIREHDAKILVHCFAGCTIEAICAALGINITDLFNTLCARRKSEPGIVRAARHKIAGLRSRLAPHEREQAVILILADEANLHLAIARALALAVDGELVQVALEGVTNEDPAN